MLAINLHLIFGRFLIRLSSLVIALYAFLVRYFSIIGISQISLTRFAKILPVYFNIVPFYFYISERSLQINQLAIFNHIKNIRRSSNFIT